MSAQLQGVASTLNLKVVLTSAAALVLTLAMTLFIAGSASAMELDPIGGGDSDACKYGQIGGPGVEPPFGEYSFGVTPTEDECTE